jgi:hypothetical protein
MTTPRGVSPKRNPSHPSPESAEVRMCNTLRHAGLRWSVGRGTMSPEAQRRIPPRGGTSLSPSPRRPRGPGPSRARGQQCILSDMCRTLRRAVWSGQRGTNRARLGLPCPCEWTGGGGEGTAKDPVRRQGNSLWDMGAEDSGRPRAAWGSLRSMGGGWAGVVGGDWVAIDCDGGGHSLVRARGVPLAG